MRTKRIPLSAVALCLASVTAFGAAEPAPFATIELADARLELARDGRFALRRGTTPLIANAQLVVAGTGWKGSGSQAGCRLAQGMPRTEGAAFLFAGAIAEPVAGVAWRFEQRVEPIAKGVRFTYTLEPQAHTQIAEASLFIDLPLPTWRGRMAALWPAAQATLPEKQPRGRHFLSGVARRVVLGGGADHPLALHFAKPTPCTVQDCREFNRPLYQLYPRVFRGGRARKGQRFTLAFTLVPNDQRSLAMPTTDYSSTAPLRVGAPRLPAASVPTHARFEIALDVAGTWRTPFDPDQIRVDGLVRMPSGREVVVPAFYTRDYSLTVVDGESLLEPKGEPSWKLRFAATEPGEHTLVVAAKDRSGEARSEPVAFTATPSDSPGYVRVSTKDPRYFAFDNGTPYFAVGENVCTWRKGVADYDTWLPRLGAVGGNYARIWMWGHCFGIEWGRPGHYRLDHAWALDHALALAEKHGIYVKLCLEAWRGFGGPRSFVRDGVPHPYAKRNGGPCEREMDVFTDPEARRMFRNRLRYVVARWGCSTHILAWEFWNEINCVWGYRGRSQDMIDWSAEMADCLRQTDPWRHLVVNSLGSFQLDDRLWKLPGIDFAQVHGYWHPTLAASKEMGKDMAELVPHWIAKIRGFGKPALFAEYGLVNPTWGHSPRADEDTEGVHLHNGLWSSTMAEAAGTAMLWWWGNYVDPNDLYGRFGSVARYVKGVPWTTAGFRPVQAKASSPQLRVMGLQGKGLVLLWLQNRRHTWWNVVEKLPIPPVDATVALSALPAGTWRIEWWDTWSGTITRETEAQVAEGTLTLAVDALERDVAVKLKKK